MEFSAFLGNIPVIVQQVGHLVRIRLKVVELVRVQEIDGKLVPSIGNAANGIELPPIVMIDGEPAETQDGMPSRLFSWFPKYGAQTNSL